MCRPKPVNAEELEDNFSESSEDVDASQDMIEDSDLEDNLNSEPDIDEGLVDTSDGDSDIITDPALNNDNNQTIEDDAVSTPRLEAASVSFRVTNGELEPDMPKAVAEEPHDEPEDTGLIGRLPAVMSIIQAEDYLLNRTTSTG